MMIMHGSKVTLNFCRKYFVLLPHVPWRDFFHNFYNMISFPMKYLYSDVAP